MRRSQRGATESGQPWGHATNRLCSIPPTVDVEALAVKRRGGGRTGLHRHRILGWCGAGQCSGPAWAARRGSVRLQVLPAALGRGRVSTARSGGTRTGLERNCIVRRDDDRARRRRARNRPCALTQGRQLHRLPVIAASRRRISRSPRSSNWRGGRVAGCISCIYPAPTHFR